MIGAAVQQQTVRGSVDHVLALAGRDDHLAVATGFLIGRVPVGCHNDPRLRRRRMAADDAADARRRLHHDLQSHFLAGVGILVAVAAAATWRRGTAVESWWWFLGRWCVGSVRRETPKETRSFFVVVVC